MLWEQLESARSRITESYSPNFTCTNTGRICAGSDRRAARWDLKGACDYAGEGVYKAFQDHAFRVFGKEISTESKEQILLVFACLIALAKFERISPPDAGAVTKNQATYGELPPLTRLKKLGRRKNESKEG